MGKGMRWLGAGLAVFALGFALCLPGPGVVGAAEFSMSNKAPDGYTLSDASMPAVAMSLPDGFVSEDEPSCTTDYVDVTNGGCNSEPPVFGSLRCGDILLGTGGNYYCNGDGCGDEGFYRDTDWFKVEVYESGLLTMSGRASFPVQFLIIDGNRGCDLDDGAVLNGVWGDPGELTTVSAVVEPGTYYLWAGTQGFDGVPCGSPYYFEYTCPRPIPTLPIWGLLGLALAIAASSVWMLRRRRQRA